MLNSPEMLFAIYKEPSRDSFYTNHHAVLSRLADLVKSGFFDNKTLYGFVQTKLEFPLCSYYSTSGIHDYGRKQDELRYHELNVRCKVVMAITDTSMLVNIIQNPCVEYVASAALRALSTNVEIIKEIIPSLPKGTIKEQARNLLSYLNDKHTIESDMKKKGAEALYDTCKKNPMFVDLADDIYTVVRNNKFDSRYDSFDIACFSSATKRLLDVAKNEPERLYPFWHRLEKGINEARVAKKDWSRVGGYETIMTDDDGPRVIANMEERVSKNSLGLKFPKLKLKNDE